MPDLSFNLTLPDHLARALVDGVPTADLDAAVKAVREQLVAAALDGELRPATPTRHSDVAFHADHPTPESIERQIRRRALDAPSALIEVPDPRLTRDEAECHSDVFPNALQRRLQEGGRRKLRAAVEQSRQGPRPPTDPGKATT